MQKHTRNYLETHGYSETEFIPCERCGKQAVDIHHIIYRSEKPKHPLLDHPVNLIAVCRPCHQYYHQSTKTREQLVKDRKLKEIFKD